MWSRVSLEDEEEEEGGDEDDEQRDPEWRRVKNSTRSLVIC